MLRKEALRVVVRADRALQAAACHQGAFGDVASPDDHLPGIGGDAVGIAVEIAAHAVHHHRLVDVPADEPVIETFLVPVPVIPVQALVGQVHRPVYVRLDGRLVGGQREEQLVQAAHMLPRFHRAVARGVLREKAHKSFRGFDRLAEAALLEYPWPGNIRELKNVIGRAVLICQEQWISVSDLNLEISLPKEEETQWTEEEKEKALLLQTLEKTGDNRSKAARLLNVSRTTLYEKLRKYHIID